MSEVILKNPQQLALMRTAGQLLTRVFEHLDGFVAPGVSTLQINDRAEAYIVDVLKARPAARGSTGSSIRSTPPSTMWCATACQVPTRC